MQKRVDYLEILRITAGNAHVDSNVYSGSSGTRDYEKNRISFWNCQEVQRLYFLDVKKGISSSWSTKKIGKNIVGKDELAVQTLPRWRPAWWQRTPVQRNLNETETIKRDPLKGITSVPPCLTCNFTFSLKWQVHKAVGFYFCFCFLLNV